MQNKMFHEINQYKDPDFPVEMYRINSRGIFPSGRWIRDFHWHEELQFTYVTAGRAVIQVNGKSYPLVQGEAIFINSGLIHSATDISDDGEYISINFPYKLLSFFSGSLMERKYVLPYTACGRMSAVVIKPEEKWETAAIELLTELEEFFLKCPYGYEYMICIKLAELWSILVAHCKNEQDGVFSVNIQKQQRLQQMLNYIYGHYSENILLEDIAAAAHISVGECCRIFKEILHTAPHAFLKEYRVQKSLELINSDRTIEEIAGLVGFNQASNFIYSFKKALGCTPAKFRRNM